MIKNYKNFIKESLLDKISGPNLDELLKNFGSYKRLIDYAIRKQNEDIILSIYNKLKTENNNDIKNYGDLVVYFMIKPNLYNLAIEIYERFKNDKELTTYFLNNSIKKYNYELIVKIYNDNKDNDNYAEKIFSIFNNISISNNKLNDYYYNLINNLIDVGFIIKLSDINDKLIFLAKYSSKLTDKILEAYERRKKKFFINKFNKYQLDNLNDLLDYKIMNDEVDVIERIFKINELEKYNHEEGIKIGILRKHIKSLKIVFEHDGGIKKSNIDYLDSLLNRAGYVPEIVKLLLEYNCPVTEKNIKTAIIHFTPNKKEESLEILGLLLEKYGEINYNFLSKAIHIGQIEVINYLLDNGYDVHYGYNILLTKGCLYGDLKMVRLALEYGADVNARNGEIMHHALSYNREYKTYESIQIIKLLFEYGYKFNLPKYVVNTHDNSKDVLDMIDKYYEEHPFIQNK